MSRWECSGGGEHCDCWYDGYDCCDCGESGVDRDGFYEVEEEEEGDWLYDVL